MISIDVSLTACSRTVESVRITVDADDMALIPKSVRLHPEYRQAYIVFRENGTNKGTNETGIKRVKSLLKAATKHNIGVVFVQNAYVPDPLNAYSFEKVTDYNLVNGTCADLETLIG